MKLLLDTQCWVWIYADPDRLPSPVRRRLRAPASQIVVSIVSVWELAIKAGLKRFDFKGPASEVVQRMLDDTDATLLTVEIGHAVATLSLPLHHRDPFDRLLIAQAHVEGLTLVTADPANLRYDINTLDARR